ncbi:MAG TPA: peroxiredoxin family protein [candidate division Zixibacteria bacterium]|nr:peroxiredoxin family protein [candidate division Zixibacteria bacterium]
MTIDLLNLVQPGFFAPEFDLENVQGGRFNLIRELKKGPLILYFYGGGWSAACVASLKKVHRILPEFGKRKGQFAAVSPESKALTKRLAEREGMNFPLLVDLDLTTIRRYGLLNSKCERPAPYPTFLVIDRERVIRFKKVVLEERDRPDLDTLLNELEKYSDF